MINIYYKRNFFSISINLRFIQLFIIDCYVYFNYVYKIFNNIPYNYIFLFINKI